jgi:hypothetical protein
MIDILTLGSDQPIRRLLAYYLILGAAVFVLFHFVPTAGSIIKGDHAKALSSNSQILQDGLSNIKEQMASAPQSGLELTLTAIMVMLTTLALMLPVSWVFMSARRATHFDQSVVQTLVILPIVVAGIVLVVRTSLALAFSLGGIVAGLRLRTTIRDVRDTVYIFLGIGVGLAAGVQSLIVAAVLSISFNFVVLFIWRYDFGRNVLEPTATAQWTEPLSDLAHKEGEEGVPDRDLVLALSPEKAAVLAKRFNRVRKMVGPTKKTPRFNSILTVTSNTLSDAQTRVEMVLNTLARRWRLDQVITSEGKPSQLYYLVRVRRNITRDRFLTSIRESAGDRIVTADLELRQEAGEEAKAAT